MNCKITWEHRVHLVFINFQKKTAFKVSSDAIFIGESGDNFRFRSFFFASTVTCNVPCSLLCAFDFSDWIDKKWVINFSPSNSDFFLQQWCKFYCKVLFCIAACWRLSFASQNEKLAEIILNTKKETVF